jgi:hypothetical protein
MSKNEYIIHGTQPINLLHILKDGFIDNEPIKKYRTMLKNFATFTTTIYAIKKNVDFNIGSRRQNFFFLFFQTWRQYENRRFFQLRSMWRCLLGCLLRILLTFSIYIFII